MRILFWNTNKKSFIGDIIQLTKDQDVDFFVLAECPLSSDYIAKELTKSTKRKFYSLSSKIENRKFKIVSRFKIEIITNFDKDYGKKSWTINKIKFPGNSYLSIIAVHLPSKLYWDDHSLSMEAINLMKQIRNYEIKNGKNTLVIGDFNMNPYDIGMTSTLGLHGEKHRDISKKRGRVVHGEYYDYFYNPMWNLLGDNNENFGSYYFPKSVHNNVKWNIIDQVLLRPSLIQFFDDKKIKIIKRIGKKALLDKKSNKINKLVSDHLPLFIQLNIS